MSTVPAFPSNDSDVLVNDRTGVGIGRAFRVGLLFGYGALGRLRNLSVGLLLIAGSAQAEVITIAALGDSLTAGYGLASDDGFVPQLQEWLQSQGVDAKVVNAGVSGDTTAGGLSRVEWTLTPEVDAMIVALGANDYLRALDPALTRQNIKGIIEAGLAANVDVLLVGMEVGSNYGPEYKMKFDAIFSDLASEYEVPIFPDWFAGLRAVTENQGDFARLMQADGLHPNAKGVAFIVDAMGPAVIDLVEGAKD